MPPKPFKPPRPSKPTKAKPAPKATSAQKPPRTSKPRPKAQAPQSSDSEADPFGSIEKNVAEQRAEEEERREGIPADLLTRLLHESFKEEGTRLSREANAAVGRYMETFVREAIARAAYMRADAEARGVGGGGYGFLEVEDLEKLAPQLLMDF